MLQRGMLKEEIENDLKGKGDFVQMDHLTRFLTQNPPLETKKFIYKKLIEIYDRKRMFLESAKAYDSLSIISLSFSEKIKNHVKEAESYIKAGKFDSVDYALKKGMGEANASERVEALFAVKQAYKNQAEVYIKEMRRAHAIAIYEKLLEMNISDIERKEIKEKLMDLYEKTGKLDKYFNIKRGL